MASKTSWGAVELWTSAFYFDGKPMSKARVETQFYFESQVFYPGTSTQIPEYLGSRLEKAREASVPFVAIASVRGEPEWLASSISTVFPSPESGPMADMIKVSSWERGTVVLPVVEKGFQCMNFFMQYPLVEKTTSNLKFCPVATWVYASRSSAPAVLMVCRDDEVPNRLQEQCVAANWKLKRLSTAPCCIFLDLFEFLAEWPGVWRSARHQLTRTNTELHASTNKVDVLQQTRALHSDTANVIALREDLRLHITAFQKYRSLISALAAKGSLFVPSPVEDDMEYLEDRTEQCLQNLFHQQESSAVIHRQLENLLSLAFNTEMVSQGQAVARLNMLAIAFLPLSYVATLFGMTNLSISAKWYPVGAVIILALLPLWFIVTSHLPKWHLIAPRKASLKQPPGAFKDSKKPSSSAVHNSSGSPGHGITLPPSIPPPLVAGPSTSASHLSTTMNSADDRAAPYVGSNSYSSPENRNQSAPTFAQRFNPLARSAKAKIDTSDNGYRSNPVQELATLRSERDYKIMNPFQPGLLSVSPGPALELSRESPYAQYELQEPPTFDTRSRPGGSPHSSSVMPFLPVSTPSASRPSTPGSQARAQETRRD
ncbi:hypothetical protein BCR34DRAFT_560453 [Clohesyomyces aquaticus]|uniref:Cora-like Mg2+ transporter protein-domain-containing protein n=1 Tax=Clohesyomyces aquaticus TaxID=1231657 RepID=A0A1Y1ZXF8_9PLEO|nr:hypothetical protein BCR34DRAFT_560453 [Clohesyomyces aquaticus]